MPMFDLTYPEGALEPQARADAVEKLTAALLRHEGAPDNAATRAMSWCLVHEIPADAFNVGGRPSERPYYRVFATVPEGTLLQGPGPFAVVARRNLVREVAEILLEAEGTEYSPEDAGRVFVLIREISDGYWGGIGTTFRMEDIAAFATPELPQTPVSEQAREALEGSAAPATP
jgi:phenylpyruvate tautomerase PptA (4-oxalocrotonate tautomerase family)